MRIKERYQINKAAKIGEEITCPSCGTVFIKRTKAQVFCTTKKGTRCKDAYWNQVDPRKRNNTTRISPANARYMKEKLERIERMSDYDHPFSSEGLEQWID